MSIIQVSERIIRETYQTLDSYLNKELTHDESELYYKDGLVYKIISKKMYRLYRESYMWILEQHKFDNCINIESLLYQGDKLIGSTTKLRKDLISLKEIIENKKIDLYEARKVLEILLNVQKELLNHNLCYTDPRLSNIGINNGNILISDLDGVDYKPDKTLIKHSFLNAYKTYICLLLNDNLYQYDFDCLKGIFGNKPSLEEVQKFLSNVTQDKAEYIKEKCYKYINNNKKTDSKLSI